MHRRTKACSIPRKVKQRVLERDEGRCVVCQSGQNVTPSAHYISRAHGGLGIEENIVTLCTDFSQNKCHYYFDNGTCEQREKIRSIIKDYLKSHYPGWSEDKLVYRKGQ